MSAFEELDKILNDVIGDDGQLIWEGRPSQWINLPYFLLCIILVVIPIVNIAIVLYTLYRVIDIMCINIKIFDDRIVIETGIFNKNINNINLYRVKDLKINKPWWWRIAGRGRLIFITSDKLTPHIALQCIPHTEFLYDMVRPIVEKQRQSNGVREFDITQ